jgi:hypothetical protein
MFDALPCFFLDNEEWKAGKLIDVHPGHRPGDATAVITAEDGTLATVDVKDVRHGTTKPAELPRVHALIRDGRKQHTIVKRHGNWLIARPDGGRVAEYPADEEGTKLAKAHFHQLEPEAAKTFETESEKAEALKASKPDTFKPDPTKPVPVKHNVA